MGNAWQVCRRLKDIIDESLLLKYHTEMQSCGMTTAPEGPSTRNLTLQERYTKLLLFDATWRSLAWRKHEVLQMQNSTALWDLYGGVLATGTPIDGNRDDWRLEFRELDSMGRRGQELEISHWGLPSGAASCRNRHGPYTKPPCATHRVSFRSPLSIRLIYY